MKPFKLHTGDMLEELEWIDSNTFDSCVTDPPYHFASIVKRFGKEDSAPAKSEGETGVYARASQGFMGQTWDGGDIAFRPSTWREVLRVLKPGAHLVAFGAPKNYHRLVCAIEDAGFEVRNFIPWLFGTGFPKSHNIKSGKFEGWGTDLKPAFEPICLARKPLSEKTIEKNLAKWGTGAINIDGCRVPTEDIICATRNVALGSSGSGVFGAADTPGVYVQKDQGRFPANIIHDGSDEVVSAFPQSAGQQGDLKETGKARPSKTAYADMPPPKPHAARNDSGSAARFFYSAKASKADREEGLAPVFNNDGEQIRANNHPTVKPTDLMRYLCRLITPPGGRVLDPFMGSGSTGKAAVLEGFKFTGIDMSADYAKIAEARILHALKSTTNVVSKLNKELEDAL